MSLMFKKPSLSPRSPYVADGVSLVVISDDCSFRETAGLQENRETVVTILRRLPADVPEAVLAASLVARLERMLGTKKRRVSLTRRREIAEQVPQLNPARAGATKTTRTFLSSNEPCPSEPG